MLTLVSEPSTHFAAASPSAGNTSRAIGYVSDHCSWGSLTLVVGHIDVALPDLGLAEPLKRGHDYVAFRSLAAEEPLRQDASPPDFIQGILVGRIDMRMSISEEEPSSPRRRPEDPWCDKNPLPGSTRQGTPGCFAPRYPWRYLARPQFLMLDKSRAIRFSTVQEPRRSPPPSYCPCGGSGAHRRHRATRDSRRAMPRSAQRGGAALGDVVRPAYPPPARAGAARIALAQ
jgi:hypothetical protein